MKYSLFLSDFDGTLVRKDGTISEKNKSAIEAYRKAGGIFAIVTGRMFSSIRPRLLELGLDDTLVAAYQGGMIAEAGTGRVLKYSAFSRDEVLEIVRYLEQDQALHLHIYCDDLLFSNFDDDYLKLYEKICGVKAIVSDVPLSEKILSENLTVCKVISLLDPSKRGALYRRLSGHFGRRFQVTTSSEWMVEVVPEDAKKSAALAFLSEYYAVPKEKVAAIGDQLNDLSMIEAADGKFAVGNAAEELKHIATVVASSEEDGVAEALQIAME